ncbi:hypothetical protein [Legionella sainthelensi]|uniref:Uncharacterized protein n=1 Tax=Legionella sainthelensi TaxID=28087 RepID=A0A2H5FM23_9GAMM|nr:hypothetical protein [Legionella sainthelensi]AUH72592.1 hypothetical protein CAB17_11400 [Legionella sainthelensi]
MSNNLKNPNKEILGKLNKIEKIAHDLINKNETHIKKGCKFFDDHNLRKYTQNKDDLLFVDQLCNSKRAKS